MLLSSSRLRYRCSAIFGLVDDDGLLNRSQKSRFRGACASPGGRKVFSPDGFQCSASMYMGITGGSKTSLFSSFISLLPSCPCRSGIPSPSHTPRAPRTRPRRRSTRLTLVLARTILSFILFLSSCSSYFTFLFTSSLLLISRALCLPRTPSGGRGGNFRHTLPPRTSSRTLPLFRCHCWGFARFHTHGSHKSHRRIFSEIQLGKFSIALLAVIRRGQSALPHFLLKALSRRQGEIISFDPVLRFTVDVIVENRALGIRVRNIPSRQLSRIFSRIQGVHVV